MIEAGLTIYIYINDGQLKYDTFYILNVMDDDNKKDEKLIKLICWPLNYWEKTKQLK